MNSPVPIPSLARLNALIDVVEALREIHPDMTLNQLLVLLYVATNPGVAQTEIIARSGLSDASASRIVAILSEYGNRGTGPFHLVELVQDARDRRIKALHLTRRGRELMSKLANLMKKAG